MDDVSKAEVGSCDGDGDVPCVGNGGDDNDGEDEDIIFVFLSRLISLW